MDPLQDKMRRWKRSLDGFISFRKAVFIAGVIFVFMLYVGPNLFSWLFGSSYRTTPSSASCLDDRLQSFSDDLRHLNAHTLHSPWRPLSDTNYIPYIGNGYFGLSTEDRGTDEDEGKIHIFGGQRYLSNPVPFKPLAQIVPELSKQESANLVHYTNGMVHQVDCFEGGVSVTSQIFAHRAISKVLVQEVRVTNPGADTVAFNVERLGIVEWKGAVSKPKTIEHGDGNQKYKVVSGMVDNQSPPTSTSRKAGKKFVVIIFRKLDSVLEVAPRMTQTLNILTSVAYADVHGEGKQELESLRDTLEEEATESLLKAVSTTSLTLRQSHLDIWRSLWTTGFGISHSMAENAVNGQQINATIYYVLSQTPAPIHSAHASKQEKADMMAQLAYSEGCYGGIPTLHATTLWKSLVTLSDVNSVVKAWMVTLEKNGCNKLIKAGADGVVQAMVLSFAALKFREEHLELNSHPKDLHRDYHMRRVSYGNGTHLNISVVVQSDNKPVLYVALDKRHRDYFACDAGCLDPPNKLGPETMMFPVKLTDPVTAILYITSDHQHMEELKDAIHFKQVAEAPAHEHHVIALHKHGNKLGGLPAIFWFSIGFLILVFHAFLFKLIWQEYCSSGSSGYGGGVAGVIQDKFRARKYSDYQ